MILEETKALAAEAAKIIAGHKFEMQESTQVPHELPSPALTGNHGTPKDKEEKIPKK